MLSSGSSPGRTLRIPSPSPPTAGHEKGRRSRLRDTAASGQKSIAMSGGAGNGRRQRRSTSSSLFARGHRPVSSVLWARCFAPFVAAGPRPTPFITWRGGLASDTRMHARSSARAFVSRCCRGMTPWRPSAPKLPRTTCSWSLSPWKWRACRVTRWPVFSRANGKAARRRSSTWCTAAAQRASCFTASA